MNAVLEWLSRWGVIPVAVCWNLVESARCRRKLARMAQHLMPTRKLEDTPLPGYDIPPPVDPRPNPPDSGLTDEEWERYLERQRPKPIMIDPRTYKELFFNRGVYMALSAFRQSPEPLFTRDSLEHKQMALAAFYLEPHFGDFWTDDEGDSSDG